MINVWGVVPGEKVNRIKNTLMWRILPAPYQGLLAELKTPTMLLRLCFPLPLELPCGCLAENGQGGLAAERSCSLHTQSCRVHHAVYHMQKKCVQRNFTDRLRNLTKGL